MGVPSQPSASLLCSNASNSDKVTMHNEGVYIPFPSCALQLSNLELNSIYLCKCLLPTMDESGSLKVLFNT
jgi:hypothetical protein